MQCKLCVQQIVDSVIYDIHVIDLIAIAVTAINLSAVISDRQYCQTVVAFQVFVCCKLLL